MSFPSFSILWRWLWLCLCLTATVRAADQTEDPQLAALETELSIQRLEARLDTIASYADGLQQAKMVAQTAGDTAQVAALTAKISKIEQEINEGLNTLEKASQAAEDRLDELFAGFQNLNTTEDPAAKAAPADIKVQEPEKPKKRRDIPFRSTVEPSTVLYTFQVRDAEWTRAGTPLQPSERKLRTGTKLVWKFNAPLPPGKYAVHVDFRMDKREAGKASLSAPGIPVDTSAKVLTFPWPARGPGLGRLGPQIGSLIITPGCQNLILESLQLPEDVAPKFVVRQFVLRNDAEGVASPNAPRKSVNF